MEGIVEGRSVSLSRKAGEGRKGEGMIRRVAEE